MRLPGGRALKWQKRFVQLLFDLVIHLVTIRERVHNHVDHSISRHEFEESKDNFQTLSQNWF